MIGSNPAQESDGKPSQQTNFGSVSMPFLDMTSFQPARAKAQSGFESMESMDSALNSTKTTPLNYMRGSRNQQQSDSIHSNKNEQNEDSLCTFLRTSASAHSESNPDLLNAETFGESSEASEPWSDSTPVMARMPLRPIQLSADPDLNSFSMDSLNLNSSSYHEGPEPYYGHSSVRK